MQNKTFIDILKESFVNTPIVKWNLYDKVLNSILLESYDEFDFGNKAIQLIEKANPVKEINFKTLVNSCSERFKEINKNQISGVKYEYPLYVFKFNFSHPNELKYINTKFNIKAIEETDIPFKMQNELITKFFIENFAESSGLTAKYDHSIIMMLNSSKYDVATIRHELGHYFKLVFNNNVKETNDLNTKFFNYLNNKEFLIQGKIDFVNQMTGLYFKHYKQKNIDLLLSYLDKLIENNADIIETDLGYHYKQMYPKDQGPLMFYEYLFKTNKKLFLEWRKILKYGLEYPH